MWSFFPILAMAIANTKVMTKTASIQVWTQNEAILINLIRIIRNESNSCCKSILCDHISLNQHWLNNLIHFPSWHSLTMNLSWSRRSWLEFWIERNLILRWKIWRLTIFDVLLFLNRIICNLLNWLLLFEKVIYFLWSYLTMGIWYWFDFGLLLL